MELQNNQLLTVIPAEKLKNIAQHFMDVLGIHIFIVDASGHAILPPVLKDKGDGYWGSDVLINSAMGFNFNEGSNFLNHFKKVENFWQLKNPLGLAVFALAIYSQNKEALGYLILGPVFLDKHPKETAIAKFLSLEKVDSSLNPNSLAKIRVERYPVILSILELLSETMKDCVEFNIEKTSLYNLTAHHREILSKKVKDAAEQMFSTIFHEEWLVCLLDVALNLTRAHGGSVMVWDKDEEVYKVVASRGLKVKSGAVKLGEGVAGLAALENKPLLITEKTKSQNRIGHLLKRGELKESIVLPLAEKDHVFAILNLHTISKGEILTEEKLSYLTNLSRLIPTAWQSF